MALITNLTHLLISYSNHRLISLDYYEIGSESYTSPHMMYEEIKKKRSRWEIEETPLKFTEQTFKKWMK